MLVICTGFSEDERATTSETEESQERSPGEALLGKLVCLEDSKSGLSADFSCITCGLMAPAPNEIFTAHA